MSESYEDLRINEIQEFLDFATEIDISELFSDHIIWLIQVVKEQQKKIEGLNKQLYSVTRRVRYGQRKNQLVHCWGK